MRAHRRDCRAKPGLAMVACELVFLLRRSLAPLLLLICFLCLLKQIHARARSDFASHMFAFRHVMTCPRACDEHALLPHACSSNARLGAPFGLPFQLQSCYSALSWSVEARLDVTVSFAHLSSSSRPVCPPDSLAIFMAQPGTRAPNNVGVCIHGPKHGLLSH